MSLALALTSSHVSSTPSLLIIMYIFFSSGLEFTSGSELSCDTVVYVNKNGVPISDKELTDNEGPLVGSAFELKCSIPQPLATRNSCGDEEMVYNIAEAKVSKIRPRKNDRKSSSNSNCNNGKSIQFNSTKEQRNYENSKSKLSSLKPDTKDLQNQFSSKLAKSTQNKHNNYSSTVSNAVKRPSSAAKTQLVKRYPKTEGVSNSAGLASQLCKRNTFNKPNEAFSSKKALVGNNRLSTPVKPPRQSITKPSITQKNESKIPKGFRRQTSLPRPCKSAGSPRSNYFVTQTNITSSSNSTKVGKSNNFYSFGNKSISNFNQSHDSNLHNNNVDVLSTTTSGAKNTSIQNRLVCGDNPISNTAIVPLNKVSSEEFTIQTERPEPVGCASNCSPATKKMTLSTSFLNPTYTNLEYSGTKHFHQRPDSMIVNVDIDNNPCQGANVEENDGINVNFYCLTFTTRNPLIPLSKQKFHRQIRQNIKRKSLMETTIDETIGTFDNTKNAMKNNFQCCHFSEKNTAHENSLSLTEFYDCYRETSSPKDCVNTFCMHSMAAPTDQEHDAFEYDNEVADILNRKATTSHLNEKETTVSTTLHWVTERKSLTDEEDNFAEDSDVKEMPKLECNYSLRKSKTMSAENDLAVCLPHKHSQNSLYNSPHHEVCLYDSNSLAISYVSTKQSCSSSSDSASRSNTSSPLTGKGDNFFRKNDKMKQLSRSVVMSKSTSKEGTRLTLVKKQKHTGGQTLELLITNENDETQNETSTSLGLSRPKDRTICKNSQDPKSSNSHTTRSVDKSADSPKNQNGLV